MWLSLSFSKNFEAKKHNPLPDDKILDWSKLKQTADDTLKGGPSDLGRKFDKNIKQEGHDGHASLHWLIHKILSYQTLQYFGIGFKHKTPKKD